MLIIMDYDETYTEHKPFWNVTIKNMRAYGIHVLCCTMRPELPANLNIDIESDMGDLNVPIIYAANHKDKWEAVQEAGYLPENAIWIDDRPMYIFMNRDFSELE